MQSNKKRIKPPLYMAGRKITCWRCKARMTVITLLAPNVEKAEGEACLLSDIQELPEDVLSYINKRVTTFKMKLSRMAGHKYLGNTCPECGVLTGEFFLHSEPGSPFFPENEEDAKSLYITEIPLKGPVFIEASLSMGTGELIMNNAKRI